MQQYRFTPLFLGLAILALGAKPGLASVKNPDSPWSLGAGVSYESSLYKFGEESRSQSMGAGVNAGYQLSPKFSLGLDASFSQEIGGIRETLGNDGHLALNHQGWNISRDLSVRQSLTAVLPLSRQSGRRDGLYTALTYSPIIAWDLSDSITPGLSLFDRLSATRAFHEFKTSTLGRSMKQYSLSNSIGASYSFSKFSISTSFSRSVAWTYEKNRVSSFGFKQSIGYKASRHVGLSLTYGNGGDALRPNGQDSNISLINENSSSFAGGISYEL